MQGLTSAPAAAPIGNAQGASHPVTRRLYADGSVSRGGADDTRQAVGSVTLTPRPFGVDLRLQLNLGRSMAGWPYSVSISRGGACQDSMRVDFYVDATGRAVVEDVYRTGDGITSLSILVIGDDHGSTVPLDDSQVREVRR